MTPEDEVFIRLKYPLDTETWYLEENYPPEVVEKWFANLHQDITMGYVEYFKNQKRFLIEAIWDYEFGGDRQ